MKKSLKLLIFFLSSAFLFTAKAYAGDFQVDIVRNYYIDDATKVKVVETHTVTNHPTSKNWINDNNNECFFVSVTAGNAEALNQTLGTIKLTAAGKGINYTKEIKGDYASLCTKFPNSIKPGNKLEFKLEYNNYGLLEKKGALMDFYAPGFKADTQKSTEVKSTDYSYLTYVYSAKILPDINFVTPDQTEIVDAGAYRKYTFSYEALLNKYIWIQFGRKQFYKFKITQEATATDNINTGYTNEYRLIAPRDVDEANIYQKVYFDRIDPLPAYIETDTDNNLIMVFKINTSEKRIITISGYTEVGRNALAVDVTTSGLVSSIGGEFRQYLQAASYWEVNDPTIIAKTREVVGSETNVYLIAKKLYDFVIDRIDYSQVKRFGLNERQGAKKTLNGGAAVCMEYSDLFLTMSRAAGVPARAVFGYGYDSKQQVDKQEAHQWVQIYLPGLQKWTSVDVTWGESGLQMAEGNLNHFFTHVASVDPNTPSLVKRMSYGSNASLQVPQYAIEATTDIKDLIATLKTQSTLLSQYPKPAAVDNFFASLLEKLSFLKTLNVSTIMIIAGSVLMIFSVRGIVKMLKQEEK